MMKLSALRALIWCCAVVPLSGFLVRPTTTEVRTVPKTATRRISLGGAAEKGTQEVEVVAKGTTTEKEGPLPVRVQRRYQTFPWRFGEKDYAINYRVEGPEDGPPILLVHGFGANINHFRFQFPALVKEGYRVYAVDLIGFGASDKPGDIPYSIELFRDLLVDFVGAFSKDEPWFLAGNSIGGLCCLAMANVLAPNQVRGIVLFNCSGGMTAFRYEDVPYYIRPILYMVQNVVLNPAFGGSSFFSRFRTRENVESILIDQGVYCDPANVDEELLEVLLAPADDKGAEDVFLKVFGGPPGPTPESLLPNVTCPVLVQWGDAYVWMS